MLLRLYSLMKKGLNTVKYLFRNCFWWALGRLADRVFKVSVHSVLIKLGVSSETEYYRLSTYETKEPETLRWIEKHFGPSDVLFDIGANIGVYTLFAALKNPGGKIYAFEPEAQNFSRLCKNLLRNGVQNVVPCNFPLSDRRKIDFFYVSSAEAGASMHSFGRISDFQQVDRDPLIRQGAVALSLDDLVMESGFQKPTMIKLDVDGLEDQILRGAVSLLRSVELKTLLVELSSQDYTNSNVRPESSIAFLESMGFRLTEQSKWIYRASGFLTQNYIFER